MPLGHHFNKYRTTKMIILQPSKLSLLLIDSTERAVRAGNRHAQQEKQLSQFYSMKNRMSTDSGLQMTFWQPGKVIARDRKSVV